MKTVERTERGWIGHFCCADRCLFRRNTLLECGDTKLVVSSVGLMRASRSSQEREFEPVGLSHYFETKAFHADLNDARYYDADVMRPVYFDSPDRLDILDADDWANDMHEAAVAELAKKLADGETFPVAP